MVHLCVSYSFCLHINQMAVSVITMHISEAIVKLTFTVTTLSCPLVKTAKGINEFIISDYWECHLCPSWGNWSLNLLTALTAWPEKNSRRYQQWIFGYCYLTKLDGTLPSETTFIELMAVFFFFFLFYILPVVCSLKQNIGLHWQTAEGLNFLNGRAD